MNEKLTKSPLTYVVAQIKFSTKLKMEEYMPELQDAIKKEFSEYKEQITKSIEFNDDTCRYNITKSWHFIDKLFTTAIAVTPNSIAIHTSKYISFEDLIKKLKIVLPKFNKIVKNELYDRIGLRYINLISNNIEKVLTPKLLGFFLQDKDIFEPTYFAKSEITQKTKTGKIKINSMHISNKDIINTSNIYIPPEMAPTTNLLSFKHHEAKNPKKEYVILDIDHSADTKGDFKTSQIIDQLNQLHKGAFFAFKKAIQKETWEKWK